MNIPTKRVIYRPDGREMTINTSDFDPTIHAEPGEKVLTESLAQPLPDFVIADAEPPAPEAEPAPPAVEETFRGRIKGRRG